MADQRKQIDARCLPSATTTWLTPRWILDALGDFDLDPCCPPDMPWRTAKRMIQQPEDGLKIGWIGRVWLNPPYGKGNIEPWLERMVVNNNGIALINVKTDTNWFHDWIFPYATALFFIKGRVKFLRPDGTVAKNGPASPSVLVAYGFQNANLLHDQNSIPGVWRPC